MLGVVDARRSSAMSGMPRRYGEKRSSPSTASTARFHSATFPMPAALRLDHAAGPQRREQTRRRAAGGRGSSGRSRSRRRRRPARARSSSSRSETISSTRSPNGAEASRAMLDHRRRGVDADHPALGQAVEQVAGDPSRAAAGVEHGLVAGEVEPLEHLEAPLLLRIGDPVVGRRVPVDAAAAPRSELRRRRRAATRCAASKAEISCSS